MRAVRGGVITLQTQDQADIQLGANDQVYLTQAAADLLSVEVGNPFNAIIGDQSRTLYVAAILVPGELDAGKNEPVFLMDLPAVQRFTNQAGAIDRVDLFVPEGPARDRIMKETLARLEQLDPQQWTWMRSDEQRQATQAMTAAFRMNLTILSGLFNCGALSYLAST